MFSRTLVVLASAALLVCATAPAHAYIGMNGGGLNGLDFNGMSVNGFGENGMSINGFGENGLGTNGTSARATGFAIEGIDLPMRCR